MKPGDPLSPRAGTGGMASKHLPIRTWLEVVGLPQYTCLFYQYAGVEDILHLTETQIKDMGVKNSAHRAKIVSSLVILKEKFHGRYKARQTVPVHQNVVPSHSTPPGSNRSTPTHTPPSMANHPDYAPYVASHYEVTSPVVSSPPPVTAPGTGLRDMMKYPWYHGNVPRAQAISMTTADGDFLVRDSLSNPGDYVLTVNHKGNVLHFMVNKQLVVAGGQQKVQYQFEEELFDRVPELIHFYQDHQKPVTEASGAIIRNAVDRTLYLDYGEIKVSQIKLSPALAKTKSNSLSPGSGTGRGSPGVVSSAPGSPAHSPSPSPKPLRKYVRHGSQPLLSLDESPAVNHRGSLPAANQQPATEKKMGQIRSGSEPILDTVMGKQKRHALLASESAKLVNTGSDSQISKPAPPKPARVPSLKKERPTVEIRNKELYEDDGRDYSDYDQVKAWPAALARESSHVEVEHPDEDWTQLDQDIPPPQDDYDEIADEDVVDNVKPTDDGPQGDYDEIMDDGEEPQNGINLNQPKVDLSYLLRKKQPPVLSPKEKKYNITSPLLSASQKTRNRLSSSGERMKNPQLPKRRFTMPPKEVVSAIDLENYVSQVLAPENKALDASALSTVKSLLEAVSAKTVAQHLTHLDLNMLRVLGNQDLGLGVRSGLELITLPQGGQMREDVLERYRCLTLFVATTIVSSVSVAARARALHHWITIAAELKALGNLLAFCAVVDALKMKQVSRLHNTWESVQRSHFQTHQMYEFKLHSEHHNIIMATSLLPLNNVSIPNVLPTILLQKRTEQVLDLDHINDEPLPWDKADDNLEHTLDTMFTHLDTMRLITQEYGLYRVTAENMMRDFHANYDLLDILRTEMHLRLLWGFKGAGALPRDRYTKMEQVLQAFSAKFEPNV